MKKKIGKLGHPSMIYAGVNTKTNEEVAIKIENSKCLSPKLPYEAKIY
jgi:hypothetical protein